MSPGEIKAFKEAQESARVFVESLDLFHPRVVKVRFTAKNRKRYLEQFHSCAKAIANMKECEKARLIVPSNLAYADTGFKKLIPPFTTLIFDVELLKISDK